MTGQIPPQSLPTVEKICSTCFHWQKSDTEEPCNTCNENTESKSGPFNWQPKTAHHKAAPIKKDVTAPDILSAAEKHMRDRAATYDKPEGERSMAQTVAVFNTFHGTELTEAQGWHFMQILKDVRLFTRAGYHADSAEDGVAYAGLKAEAKAKE